MAHWPHYDKGDWDAICDSCGRKFKARELKKRWDGLMVCWQDFEPRQPQDFVKAQIDKQAVPWSRPEGSDQFIPTGIISAVAGIAVAGVAVAGNQFNPGLVPPGTFTI
jgi:hypothetical protein